ncbi:hypothetical protein [Saccharopolyspora spinosa]|uniref:Glycerate kinase n=1 Tax=Saccharopolyspora spinosa TaxID=60894 RepID=A0A2N3XS95_SACSN|nr:hypothetical protein [Saccharopolyspora spinosa]PKW13543.1 glycerate kinase [Saccharopolyspora spinosa]
MDNRVPKDEKLLADTSYDHGIDAITGILTGPVDLADATARTLRMLLVGRTLRVA